MLSRNSSLSGNGPPIVLEETDYPLAEGFDKTQVRFLIEHCFKEIKTKNQLATRVTKKTNSVLST
jgi:hypothetical protein